MKKESPDRFLIVVFCFFWMFSASGLSLAAEAESPASAEETAQVGTTAASPVLSAPLWRVDDGFDSILQVQNVLQTESVEVTPVLYFQSGGEFVLPSFRLAAGEVRQVSLRQALLSLSSPLWNGYSETGTAALFCDCPHSGAIGGSMQIVNREKSLVFNVCFKGTLEEEPAEQTVEGLWWKETPQTEGFVAVTNTSEQSRLATIEVRGADGEILFDSTELLAPHVLRLFRLDELPQAQVGKSAMGGVRIRFQGRPGEILYSGGLVDEKRGYSADLPFFFRRPQAERLTYAGVGLMTGKPEPEAGFSEQVRFSPFLVLRNTTEEELPVDVFLHFTLDGQNQLQPLPVEPLQAGETRQVRLQPLLAKLGLASFNGTFNLTLGFEGRPGDLVMALGSVDPSGNYVLQAHPDGVGKSLARGLPYWNIEEGNDTWISLWNPGQTDQELLLEIHYNQPSGSGSYHHPVSLTAGQSAFVSLRKLIEAQQPDGQGNVIPWDALEGSAVLMSAAGFDQEIDVAAALTILNARLATCSYYCITCYGYTNVFISPSASDILVGEQKQLTLFASHTSGYNYDKTSNASWSSENPSIASVGTGSGTRGLVTGNAPGSTDIRASITLHQGSNNYCGYNPSCSYFGSKTFTAAAQTGVANPPQFVITTRAFIKPNHVGPIQSSCVFSGGVYFKGDDRSFSSTSNKFRTEQKVTYRSDPNGTILNHARAVGETRSYAQNAIDNNGVIGPEDEDGIVDDCSLWHQAGFADTMNMNVSETGNNGVRIFGGAGNPLVTGSDDIAPIDWDYIINFDVFSPTQINYSLTVTHDCYPAHEAYIGNQTVYTFTPTSDSPLNIASCLAGFDEITTIRSGSVQ